MSDPAIEAAERAWLAADEDLPRPYKPGERGLWTPKPMEAAAREALKPIREVMDNARSIAAHGEANRQDFYDLVDALTPLIYTSEELS